MAWRFQELVPRPTAGLKFPTLFSGYHHQQEAEPRFVGHVANITVTVGREAVLSCSVTDLQDYKEGPLGKL